MFKASDISGVPNYMGHMYDPSPDFKVHVPLQAPAARKKKSPLDAFCAPPSSQHSSHYHPNEPITHSQGPIVNGTSVVAVKFSGGVVMAADTLGSYGSLARFKGLQRIRAVSATTAIGAGGEYGDFQELLHILDDFETEDYEQADGATLDARETWKLVSRIQYNRRNKMDPLWNQLVVAGTHAGKPFLAYSDLHGSAYEDNFVATGYGAYLGLPLLRRFYREDMSEAEAVKLVKHVMEVLYYRDKNTINKISVAVIKADGVVVNAPEQLSTTWEIFETPENAAVQTMEYVTPPLRN